MASIAVYSVLYILWLCTWMAWGYLSTQHNCIAARGRHVPESIASAAFSPLVYRARKSKYTYSPVTIKMDADWSLRYSLKAMTQFMCALCAMRKRNQININTHAIHRCRIVVSLCMCMCACVCVDNVFQLICSRCGSWTRISYVV